MSANVKPWVQTACICEKVLIEPDKVPSLIRIVDTYNLRLPKTRPPGFKTKVDLTAFVSIKAGDAVGQFEVGMRLVKPSGEIGPVQRWPVEFRGAPEQGASLKVDFSLVDPQVGLHWFDVVWGNDDVLTRIPFRLKAKPEPSDEAEPETETK